ncbi:PTS sugar transporter subunit IIB [Propionicimonas sp.]|uniref:PTS sugar transporter subunit IIB n=1 Tax=Propionicimonas sp. TaxID=1955623 RepID=UPI0039E4DCC7
MKRILLACGSGIVTSTAVRFKIEKQLDDRGYKGQYKIEQCKIAEVVAKAPGYDFVISTTLKPDNLKIPFVRAVSFLTGIGTEETMTEILGLMDA